MDTFLICLWSWLNRYTMIEYDNQAAEKRAWFGQILWNVDAQGGL